MATQEIDAIIMRKRNHFVTDEMDDMIEMLIALENVGRKTKIINVLKED